MSDHAPEAARVATPRSRSLRPLIALIVAAQVLWLLGLGWALLTFVT
jgi:hypothetical protein